MLDYRKLTNEYGKTVTEKYSYDNNLSLMENVKRLGDSNLEKKPDGNVCFEDVQRLFSRGHVDPFFLDCDSRHFNNENVYMRTVNFGLRESIDGDIGFYVVVILHPWEDETFAPYYIGGTTPAYEIRGTNADFVQDDSLSDAEFAFYNFAIWLHLLEKDGDETGFDDRFGEGSELPSFARDDGEWLGMKREEMQRGDDDEDELV